MKGSSSGLSCSVCLVWPQVPPAYLLSAPIAMEGQVMEGFGRGSSQMGVPTANIEPGPLKDTLEGLPLGVYFGWAHRLPLSHISHSHIPLSHAPVQALQ
jgi:hypothetical protein